MAHFTRLYEENYLKAIYKLAQRTEGRVTNIVLSRYLDLNPASVLEMVRKMSDKGLTQVLPDKSIQLTGAGEKTAISIIRRHRLWEVFLVQKLGYQWHEVHHLAEQLEHIDSEDLVDRLESFLDYPVVDPHGDPIPGRDGAIQLPATFPLLEALPGKRYLVRSFADPDDAFLDYLGRLELLPGTELLLSDIQAYDHSCHIHYRQREALLSEKAARNILVETLPSAPATTA